MTNVLVTGGAGFIGTNLCRKLVEKGCNVFSLDNYSKGSSNNHIPGVEYIADHTMNIGLYNYIEPEYVYHFGEYSRVEQSFDEPGVVWEDTVTPIVGVLNYCRIHGSKLVYSASSTKFSVMGSSLSPYTFSKCTNVDLIHNYDRWYDYKNYSIVYFYNVYGPNEISTGPYATVIAKFLDDYKNGKPLTVTSPGDQTRNFTHVDDIIRGVLIAGEKDCFNVDHYIENAQIGNPKDYSIIDIARAIDPHNIEFTPPKKGNRLSSKVDRMNLVPGLDFEHDVMDYIEDAIRQETK